MYNWQRWSFICIRWMYRYEDIIRNTYVCTYILVLYICINILHTEYICTDRIVNSIWSYAFYSRSRDKITHDWNLSSSICSLVASCFGFDDTYATWQNVSFLIWTADRDCFYQTDTFYPTNQLIGNKNIKNIISLNKKNHEKLFITENQNKKPLKSF